MPSSPILASFGSSTGVMALHPVKVPGRAARNHLPDLVLPPQSPDAMLVNDTTLETSLTPRRPAITLTSAAYAERPDTWETAVPRNDVANFVANPHTPVSWFQHLSSRPTYTHSFFWSLDEDLSPLNLACFSEIAQPLPSVPINELHNKTVLNTINSFPHLFNIITPINSSLLQAYLTPHPNQNFVMSVVNSLQNGFWPWVDTSKTILPFKLDVKEYLFNPFHLAFANQQRDVEVTKCRFSPTFNKLYNGMLGILAGVVPKPNSSKLHLVINHSNKPFSRNSLIDKSRVSVPLDGIQNLGKVILCLRCKQGNAPLMLMKSNISEAYCLCPMAPLWQIKQVIKIDSRFNADHCNNFGSRAGEGIWGSVFLLVLWIATFCLCITDFFGYIDDTFMVDLAGPVLWYAPYWKFMPEKQAKLLYLWDKLGIPHAEEKQVSGPALTIIGFHVNTVSMTITMPRDSLDNLISAICKFAVMGCQPMLAEYQAIAGWINWSLNTYPLLRPCLSAVYKKMSGKKVSSAKIYINKRICQELTWAANYLASCDGVYFINSTDWALPDANYVLLTDACLFGMGFWSPRHNFGFQYRIDNSSHPIFYWEVYMVLSAFYWILFATSPPPTCVIIYCDNMNTVNLFSTLCTQTKYNPIILTACDLMLQFNCQLRIVHISGAQNAVADAILRFDNDTALVYSLNLLICPFTPPQLMLGADVL